MTPMPLVDATDAAFRADALAEALRTHGACRLPAFPDAAATQALREDLLRQVRQAETASLRRSSSSALFTTF